MTTGRKSNYSSLAFFFFLISLFIIKFGFHELWKDEWQAWLIAKDTTWKELFNLLPEEGHPSLWFLILRASNFIHELILPEVPDVIILQSIHFLLTGGAYFFLFKKMELPLWMKSGFAFSYFLFFEYSVINRSYILLPLLIFAAVYLLQKEKTNYILVAVILFLLCQVEVYGVIAAGSLGLYLWLNNFKDSFFSLNRDKIVLSASIATGALVFYFTVTPQEATNTATFEQASSLGLMNFLQSLQAITTNTFYPGIFPTALANFNILLLTAGIALIIAFYFMFKKNKGILKAYFSFLFLFWLFSSIIYIGGLRHWGIHLIVFIGFLSFLYAKTKRFSLWEKGLIISFLVFLGIHNMKIVVREINEPFSNSEAAGNFIKNHFNDVAVVGINKPYMTPAIGYAEKRFYSLPYGDTYSYFKWKEKQYIPNMKDLDEFKKTLNADRLLVVFNKPLPPHIFTRLQPVKAFNEPSIREEDFYLYLFN